MEPKPVYRQDIALAPKIVDNQDNTSRMIFRQLKQILEADSGISLTDKFHRMSFYVPQMVNDENMSVEVRQDALQDIHDVFSAVFLGLPNLGNPYISSPVSSDALQEAGTIKNPRMREEIVLRKRSRQLRGKHQPPENRVLASELDPKSKLFKEDRINLLSAPVVIEERYSRTVETENGKLIDATCHKFFLLGKNADGQLVMFRIGRELDDFHTHEYYTAKKKSGVISPLWVRHSLPTEEFIGYFIDPEEQDDWSIRPAENIEIASIMIYLLEQAK